MKKEGKRKKATPCSQCNSYSCYGDVCREDKKPRKSKKIVEEFYRDYYDNFHDGAMWAIKRFSEDGPHCRYELKRWKVFKAKYFEGHNDMLLFYRERIDEVFNKLLEILEK